MANESLMGTPSSSSELIAPVAGGRGCWRIGVCHVLTRCDFLGVIAIGGTTPIPSTTNFCQHICVCMTVSGASTGADDSFCYYMTSLLTELFDNVSQD